MSFFDTKNPFKDMDASSADILESAECDHPGRNKADTDNRWFPPVDVLESHAVYLFKADLPGLKAGEVRVLRIGESLVISGHRNLAYRQRTLRLERPHGYFTRRFPLPEDASRQQIQAGLSDGVLQITVRKVSPDRRETGYSNDFEVNVN